MLNTTYQVIDTRTLDAQGQCAILATYPTHRKAFNHCCRLEPTATQGVWRYLVRTVRQ